MELVGEEGEAGLCISWIPNGLLVELAQKKVDSVRIQYEQQVLSLQRQLEAERRNNQEEMDRLQKEYAELVEGLRDKLDSQQQTKLDQVISQLTQVHAGEIQQLQATHQHDLSLEVTALKVSLEQVYSSKCQLEVAEQKLRYEQRMEALSKQHKEEVNRLMADRATDGSPGQLSSAITDRYNQLVQRISHELEEKYPSRSERVGADGDVGEQLVSRGDREIQVPLHTSQELRNLLLSQQEEITSLRSKVLTEYESLLQSRTQVMHDQTQEVSGLEEQMVELQKQYDEQLQSMQEKIQTRNEEQQHLWDTHRVETEQEQEELRNHYEKRLQDMEAAFEKEIKSIEEKYEDQITNMIQSRLSEGSDEVSREASQDREVTSLAPLQHSDYIHKTMALTAISDTDSDSIDTPRSAQASAAARLKELESELVDRDVQLKELKSKLDSEQNRTEELDQIVSELRLKVDILQQEATDALAQCSQLQKLLEDKDQVIHQLEVEKAESDKLYRDLLEKESPRSKISVNRDQLSGSSVDDSFTSARDSIHDTPRSGLSDTGEYKSPRSDIPAEENRNDIELEDSIPFANETSEFAKANNSNNNNNNNNNNMMSCSSVEDVVENLKKKVEELDHQLAEARQVELQLRCEIEDKDHSHREMIETLKQELEHEKKMEVETLQSEFRIQMEIELKRQAAELAHIPSAQPESTNQTTYSRTDHSQEDQTVSTASTSESQPEAGGEQSPGANTNVFSAQNLPRTPSQSSSISEHLETDLDPESQPSLLQTTGFDQQQAILEAVQSVPLNDSLPHVVTAENMSDDSKATTPAVSSPTHSVTTALSLPDPTPNTLPLTDIEKEMEAMREEYETKLTQLREELDRAEEERTTMTFKHQEEMENIRKQLDEAENRYDRLMEGVQNGEHPQLNQLMKDKYDEELELAKSLIQKDFDETLKAEKKKFVEKHRKLMEDFMGDRGQEEEKMKEEHQAELAELRQALNQEFEDKLKEYQQEIERLSRDLDLLRDISQDETNAKDNTLPEIDEITLSFQEQDTEVQSESLDSHASCETSTPVKRPKSCEVGVQYEESEDETEAERAPTVQIRTFADVVRSPTPLSPNERQEMELKIQQLVSQVEHLTHQLAEARGEGQASTSPQGSPQHSPHNETLKGDGPALIAMLQSDLDRISAERESVQRTNDRLLSLLSDSVKTYVGVEDTINRKLSQVVSGTPRASPGQQLEVMSGQGSRPGSVEPVPRLEAQARVASPAVDRYERKGATPDADTSQDSHTMDNTSILSNATDEGLEISQRLAESIFVGPDLDAEGEEILTDARGRLQTAVGQLLELMERSTVQLMEAKATQQELLDTLAARAREVDMANSRNSELDSQLATEIEAKEYLGLELHKAEGLISGYTAERESLESQIQALEEQREALIIELDTTRSRLDEFQRSQSELDSMRDELSHQRQLLQDNAGQETQVEELQVSSTHDGETPALLNELASLNQDKREVTSQLQYQLDQCRKRLTEQDTAAEEAERRHETALEERNRTIEDMRLQLENVERQLKASKAFVDEQMAEREQEREEHQREVERLEQMLEGKDRSANSQQRLQREIADLTEQLQSRIASQSAMHQRTVDLQKALEDKELSAHDLKAWVSQLESELDQRGSVEEQLKQRITKLERQLTEISDEGNETEEREETTTGTEKKERSSPLMSPVRRTHRESTVSIEEEVHMTRQVEEELQHENTALKEQVQQQLLQISGLRNQLDELRNYGGDEADSDVAQLRLKLQTERDALEKMEEKLSEAQSKIENLELTIKSKDEETEVIRSKVAKILEMGDVQEENETLKSQLEELQTQISHMSSVSALPNLPPELLEEKNQEIEELRQKLQEVETGLSQRQEEEILHQGKVHELQTRLKERDEEISDLQDNITSLRRGEPCLDVSLPLNEDAGNILNISMTGRTTRSARAVTPTSIQQELEDTMAEREGEVSQLREELDQARRELGDRDQELASLRSQVTTLTQEKQENQTDQEKIVSSLQDSVQHKDQEIYELTLNMEELKETQEMLEKQLEDKDAELSQVTDERDKCQEQLHEKEDRLDQMFLQIDSLQQEISSLTTFQQELQKDFDTVQSMLDEKEREIESLTKELTDNKVQAETLETVLQLEKMVASLRKELAEKHNVVEEKEEELYELHDKLEEMETVQADLQASQTQLAEVSQQLADQQKLRHELEEALAREKDTLEKMRDERDDDRKTENEKISSLEKTSEEKDNRLKELEEKIENLEKQVEERQEKLEGEVKIWEEKLEKNTEEYMKKVHELEEELQLQGANCLALQLDAERNNNLTAQVESLKLQVEEKDNVVEGLQKQLENASAEKGKIVEDLQTQLDVKEKEVEELSNLKRQLEETEEQLRLRQTALLDVRADKEQLVQDLAELDQLKNQLQEKDQNIEELEGQLRFRQACILDMEAEKERIFEERDDMEVELREELQKKDASLEELQRKYDELKESINEEVLHMEQEMQQSSQSRRLKTSSDKQNEEEESEVSDLSRKLQETLDELGKVNTQLKETQERLDQTCQQLGEREDQIQQLQAEVEPRVQVSTRWEKKAESLEQQLHEAEDRAERIAEEHAECQNIISRLESQLAELQKNTSDSAIQPSSAVNLSASLPLPSTQIEARRGMSRWESEPIGLALGSRDSVYLRFRMSEVERLSRQQQKELAEKNKELERVREDLEKWLQKGKGQDALQEVIKEKESRLTVIQSELETIRTQLIEREQLIVSLREQLQSLQSSHQDQLTSRDQTIADLQQQIYQLKSTPGAEAASPPRASGVTVLSPETKQSISHLKQQLRKAHEALEEMQQKQGDECEVGAGDASRLRRPEGDQGENIPQDMNAQHQEQIRDLESTYETEVRELKSQHDEDLRQLRQLQERKLEQALTEQRQTLEKQHKTEINQLQLQHQQQLHQLREKRLEQAGRPGSQAEEETAAGSSLVSADDVMPERLQALLERLNQLGEHLLSVSDLRYLQQHLQPVSQGGATSDTTAAAWGQERHALMDTIDSLKDLLQQADRVVNMGDEDGSDWRGEMLQGLVTVYEKERRVLQTEINTSDSLYPEVDIITQLEGRLHDLEQVHQSGLDEILRADRQSMIDEIDSLHHCLLEARSQLQDARDELSQRIARLEEAKSKAEWKLQRQIQMLEYKLQQEGVVQEDLKKSLKIERQRVSELSSQSSHERSHTLELQSELSSTQIQLSKVKDALEREQQRFSSVTDALEEERAKTVRLTELLDSAKRKLRSLQEEVSGTDARHQQRSHSEEGYIKELQEKLKRERLRSSQFSGAEEQAKAEVSQLTEEIAILNRKLSALRDDCEAKIETIHREQMEKELQRRLDSESEAVSKLTELLDTEQDSHQVAMDQERGVVKKLRRDMETLKSESNQLKHHYEAEKSRADHLHSELEHVRSDLAERVRKGESVEREMDSVHITSQKQLRMVEKDKEELKQKVNQLEHELERVQQRTVQLERELDSVGQRADVGQQTRSSAEFHREAINTLITASVVDQELKLRLAECCTKLQTVARQLQGMSAASQQHRGSAGYRGNRTDGEGSDALAVVMTELQQLRDQIREREESTQQNGGESTSHQWGELLEHNQQLAEHIVKLKQEKEQLVDSMHTLEARLQVSVSRENRTQMNLPQYSSDTNSEEDGVYDRTIWASERLSLQMALDSAEHEIQRLRNEIQRFRSVVSSEGQLVHGDADKSQRLYGKYLRAESFRKALIYQKKYLLLLLGGYRDTEQETLAILASMGGFPSPHSGIHARRIRTRAFTVFRSAGRVVIAVFRMKYLVKKWKRATRVGSPVVTGQINQQNAYVPSASSYPSHQRRSPQSYHLSPSSNSTTTRSSDTPHSMGSDYIDTLSNGGQVSTLGSTVNTRTTGPSRLHSYTTPPTKDPVKQHKPAARGNRDNARRRILQEEEQTSVHRSMRERSRQTDRDDDDNFLHYLESVQQQLSETDYETSRSSSRRVAWR